MPAKPQWVSRIDQITAALTEMTDPFLDRQAVEQLFGVRRRRANELMRAFGEFQTRNAFLVRRDSLIEHLHRMPHMGEVRYEVARRQKLGTELMRLDHVHTLFRYVCLYTQVSSTDYLRDFSFHQAH